MFTLTQTSPHTHAIDPHYKQNTGRHCVFALECQLPIHSNLKGLSVQPRIRHQVLRKQPADGWRDGLPVETGNLLVLMGWVMHKYCQDWNLITDYQVLSLGGLSNGKPASQQKYCSFTIGKVGKWCLFKISQPKISVFFPPNSLMLCERHDRFKYAFLYQNTNNFF